MQYHHVSVMPAEVIELLDCVVVTANYCVGNVVRRKRNTRVLGHVLLQSDTLNRFRSLQVVDHVGGIPEGFHPTNDLFGIIADRGDRDLHWHSLPVFSLSVHKK